MPQIQLITQHRCSRNLNLRQIRFIFLVCQVKAMCSWGGWVGMPPGKTWSMNVVNVHFFIINARTHTWILFDYINTRESSFYFIFCLRYTTNWMVYLVDRRSRIQISLVLLGEVFICILIYKERFTIHQSFCFQKDLLTYCEYFMLF